MTTKDIIIMLEQHNKKILDALSATSKHEKYKDPSSLYEYAKKEGASDFIEGFIEELKEKIKKDKK